MMNRLLNRHSEFDTHTMVMITESGKEALEQDLVTPIRQYSILSSLDQHSPRSLSDLAKESQLPIGVVKNEVIKLKRQKMIKMLEE